MFLILIGSVLKYHIHSPIMPKATQKSACGKHNLLQEESEVPRSPEDTASSDQEKDQEPDPEVSFHPSRAQQAILNMFMPCIETPRWTGESMMLSTTDV